MLSTSTRAIATTIFIMNLLDISDIVTVATITGDKIFNGSIPAEKARKLFRFVPFESQRADKLKKNIEVSR